MKCKQCGTEFEGSYCPNCGTRAENAPERCPQCGNICAPTEKFCRICGCRLDAGRQDDPFGEFPQNPQPHAAAHAPQQAMPEPPVPAERPKPSPLIAWLDTSYPLFNMMNLPIGMLFLSFTFITLIAGYFSIVTAWDAVRFALTPVLCAAVLCFVIYFVYKFFPWTPRGHKSFMKELKDRHAALNSPLNQHRTMIRATAMFAPVLIVVLCVLLYFSTKNVWTVVAFCALIAVLSVFYIAKNKLIRRSEQKKFSDLAIYGKEKPARGDKPIVTNADVADALYRYEEQWKDYLLYKPKLKAYQRGVVFTAGDANRTLTLKSALPRLICIVLCVVLSVAAAIGYFLELRNMFSADKLEGIGIGMTVSSLQRYMGDPYERTESGTLCYYDRNYTRLLKRNANFNPDEIQDADDLENAFQQSAELESTEFAYIEIATEQDENGSDIVKSVFFNPSRTRRNNDVGEVSQIRAPDAQIGQNAVSADILVCVNYSDGSLFKGKIEAQLDQADSNAAAGDSVTLYWWDGYSGSNIAIQAIVV